MFYPEAVKEYCIPVAVNSDESSLLAFSVKAGLKLATPDKVPFGVALQDEILQTYHGIYYQKIGVAIVRTNLRQMELLLNRPLFSVHPSPFFHSNSPSPFIGGEQTSDFYLKPFSCSEEAISDAKAVENTWGIESTGVSQSSFSGKGVKVAILDTGIQRDHEDFKKGNVESISFLEGESAEDGNGHGTHCAGIIAGPKHPRQGKRYGVAPEVDLFVAKVLSNSGSAHVRYVYEGMEWALQKNCRIISISLGNRVRRGISYSPSFEKAAQMAQAQGALVIAAAGNDSYRQLDRLLPISEPANCPSVMAVAAVGVENELYHRSNAGLNSNGGELDIAGPGVAIHSAYKSPENYKKLNGTSIAASFVTGIAAHYMEARPNSTPQAIRALLKTSVIPLNHPATDVGAGLVQAPWS